MGGYYTGGSPIGGSFQLIAISHTRLSCTGNPVPNESVV